MTLLCSLCSSHFQKPSWSGNWNYFPGLIFECAQGCSPYLWVSLSCACLTLTQSGTIMYFDSTLTLEAKSKDWFGSNSKVTSPFILKYEWMVIWWVSRGGLERAEEYWGGGGGGVWLGRGKDEIRPGGWVQVNGFTLLLGLPQLSVYTAPVVTPAQCLWEPYLYVALDNTWGSTSAFHVWQVPEHILNPLETNIRQLSFENSNSKWLSLGCPQWEWACSQESPGASFLLHAVLSWTRIY